MGYTLTFKTLANKTCIVKIDGGGTALTGAANPFVFDEDADTNLLNVIRVKTGYLNLIETTNGSLDGLFATTNTQHTVEATLDSKLIFYGYLQAQNFGKRYAPAPQEISFPIISPLGVIAEKHLNPIISNIPGVTTLGTVMNEICTALGYDKIMVPENLLADSVNPMHVSVNNFLLSPYNYNYGYGKEDLFSPLTYQEFLEAFCNLYGVIAHDSLYRVSSTDYKVLLFARYNYSGNYKMMDVSTLGDPSVVGTSYTPVSRTFTTLFDISTADGKEERVVPIGKLEIDHDEYVIEEDMTLKLSTCGDHPTGRIGSMWNVGQVMYLIPVAESDGNPWSSDYYSLNTAEYISYAEMGDKVRIGGTGDNEVIEISWGDSSHPDKPLFSYCFMKIPRTDFGILMRTKDHLYNYRIKVFSDGKWLKKDTHGNITWDSTMQTIDFTWNTDTGEYRIDNIPKTTKPVFIDIMAAGSSVVYFGDPVTKLGLIVKDNPLAVYDEITTNPIRTIKQEGFQDEQGINMLFHDYIDNPGRIIGGSLLAQNDYAYMFTPLKVLTITAKKTAANNLNNFRFMIDTFSIDGESGWKMIAASEEPWNDNLTMTFCKNQS